jgi:hypothetical protein
MVPGCAPPHLLLQPAGTKLATELSDMANVVGSNLQPNSPLPPAAPLTQKDFVGELSADGGEIDLQDLSTPARRAIDEAGVGSQLDTIAGKDHRISGRAEFKKLFGVVQRADGKEAPPTRSGALYEALKNEVAANRAVNNGRVSANSLAAGHGTIDTNSDGKGGDRMSAPLRAQLAKAGVSLEKIAGPDGQVKGEAEFRGLMKAAVGDPNASIPTKRKTPDGTVADLPDSPETNLARSLSSEVEHNRTLPQYAEPGSKRSENMRMPLATDTDALTVPKKEQKAPVDLKLSAVNQMSLHPGDTPEDEEKRQKACGEASFKAANDFIDGKFGKKRLWFADQDQAIQVGYSKNAEGQLDVDPAQAKRGHEYIDRALDKGYPVVVGVAHEDRRINFDHLTDHYVVIDQRGYDKDGRLFYGFMDPGDSGRQARFYVDKDTGMLFKQGADRKTGYARDDEYEVAHVKTYRGL